MTKILFIGDIVGKPGRKTLQLVLPEIIARKEPDLIIANGENAAGGAGITESVFAELIGAGVDVVTGGNHSWDRKEALEFIDHEPFLLRPANYPEKTTPGKGSVIIQRGNTKIAVLNLMGRVFMRPLDCPFACAEREIAKLKSEAALVIVDFHAEATSEKQAMGWHLAGKVSALIGTHTHVQTADEKMLSGYTAYISDAGMTGQYNSILGVDPGGPLHRFTTQLPCELKISGGKKLFNAVMLEIDENSGRATLIERINKKI